MESVFNCQLPPLHNTYNITQHIQPQQFRPKTPVTLPKDQLLLFSDTATASSTIKSYVPYSSVLSFMASPSVIEKDADEAKSNNFEKKKSLEKSKATKIPKNGMLLNPLSDQVTKKKWAMKIEIQKKKQKAQMTRKKAQSKIVTTIELDDSDEDDSDCIPVDLHPPPLITLDSSDEETIEKKRGLSPSSSTISDDFIVAGDKRRIANPFKQDEAHLNALQKIAQRKEGFQKVKALSKVTSPTSSSDSARSSCERNVKTAPSVSEQKKSTGEPRPKRKSSSRSSLDNEDSIYWSKGNAVQQSKAKSCNSSDDETPCVNAKNSLPRRRKSTGSRKKSTDCEKEGEDDESTRAPLTKRAKRLRFITPSYDDDEFATMISSIVRSKDTVQDESDVSEADGDKSLNEETETVKSSELVLSKSLETVVDPETIEVNDTINVEDCELIEEPFVIVDVPDEDEDNVVSDSEDSMRGFKVPIPCDLSLNVTQVPYDPHEYIRDYGESSREMTITKSDALLDPEVGWNEEVKFFYDGSWGDENFNISTILNEMPRDQKFWRVINADRNRTSDSGKRIRCMRCNEFGHIASKCNRPKKRVVCFMCGEEGHRETRCPNSICLRVSFIEC